MAREVIWTAAAAQDYLDADSRLVPARAIDGAIELLRLFPDMGTSVGNSKRARRILIGRKRICALYYASQPDRIITLALIDLRQAPAKIEEMLEARGIKG